MEQSVKFLSFDEAVTAAKTSPGTEYIGLRYVPPFTRLEAYVIDVDTEEPDYVRVQYEGGQLFDVCGEEDFYGLAEVPDEARGLFYARKEDLGDGDVQVLGMTSEFALQAVLPGLTETRKYKSHEHFIQEASREFLSFWRQA